MRKLDKAKKSNIKCEHCIHFRRDVGFCKKHIVRRNDGKYCKTYA